MVRAAVLSGVFLAIYASWQLTRWGGAAHKTLIGDLFFMPINVAGVVAALLAARRCRAEPRVRRSWQLLALALAFYLLGDVVQTYYEVVARAKPYPSLGDVGYLAFYPVALAALLRLPVTRRSPRGMRVNRRVSAVRRYSTGVTHSRVCSPVPSMAIRPSRTASSTGWLRASAW